MLSVNFIKANKEELIERLKVKNFDAKEIFQKVIKLDEERKSFQTTLDSKLAESNKLAKEIGILFRDGKAEEANKIKERTSELKEENKKLNEELKKVNIKLNKLLLEIPNIPHPSVKAGKDDEDNEILFTEENIEEFSDENLPHWELAKKYDIIDFDLGNKITGAGFPVYKGKGARLQRALISYFLDKARDAGYLEVQPPLMVNEDSAHGTGQLPDKDGQMYYIGEDNLYMIPTAEVPVTNIYRNIILNEEDFPLKNTAYSACFRREAGSYGKDVKGLNRLHQFDKVEIVCIEHPDKSYERLEEMSSYIQSLIKELNLPYRVLRLCGGDLSFTAALTYDMEVYSKAQKRWLEVSSVSNFEDYQANRLKLRFKDSNKKKRAAHTLNGSALALPRILAALLENNQTKQGILIPDVLHKYTGFKIID